MPKYIKYVGKKPVKTDNVNPSPLVWAQNEVIEVDDTLATKLLAHRDIWVAVGEEEYMKKGWEKKAPVKTAAPIPPVVPTANAPEVVTPIPEVAVEAKEGATAPTAEETGLTAEATETLKTMTAAGNTPGEIGKALDIHHFKVVAVQKKLGLI